MGLALHHQYLQAIMVVQMNVQHRLDFTFEGVLQMSKVTHQLAGVMVIHHRDGADGLLIGAPFFFDDALANQIAYGLGPVGVAHRSYRLLNEYEARLGALASTRYSDQRHTPLNLRNASAFCKSWGRSTIFFSEDRQTKGRIDGLEPKIQPFLWRQRRTTRFSVRPLARRRGPRCYVQPNACPAQWTRTSKTAHAL